MAGGLYLTPPVCLPPERLYRLCDQDNFCWEECVDLNPDGSLDRSSVDNKPDDPNNGSKKPKHPNNGHGNDEDGSDSSNPGKKGNDGTDDDGKPGKSGDKGKDKGKKK